jgi:hypothetical protein
MRAAQLERRELGSESLGLPLADESWEAISIEVEGEVDELTRPKKKMQNRLQCAKIKVMSRTKSRTWRGAKSGIE